VVPASPDGRRFAVFNLSDRYTNINSTQEERDAYFEALYKEVENGGLEAMLYDLLKMPLRKWHPRQIPNSKALAEQKQLSMSSLEAWLESVTEAGVLPSSYGASSVPKEAATTNDLMHTAKEFDQRLASTLSAKKLALFLRNHGCISWRSKDLRGWTFPPLAALRARWTRLYGVEFNDGRKFWGGPSEDDSPDKAEPSTAGKQAVNIVSLRVRLCSEGLCTDSYKGRRFIEARISQTEKIRLGRTDPSPVIESATANILFLLC
jgi:hypothetical protein